MKVLLDTCVLSEIRRPKGNPKVIQAVESRDSEDLFISVISIGEIVKGITLLDDRKRKQELQNWVQGLQRYHADRILGIDLETTNIWGEITAIAQKKGKTVSASDCLIAATAIKYGLHVMTRNTEDFEPTGVMLINPWKK